MSIGVRFPDHAPDPKDRLSELLDQLSEGYAAQRDARLRELLDTGIERERISIVTYAQCSLCHGAGSVMTSDDGPLSIVMTLSDCPECPGICVDGKPISRMPTRGT